MNGQQSHRTKDQEFSFVLQKPQSGFTVTIEMVKGEVEKFGSVVQKFYLVKTVHQLF